MQCHALRCREGGGNGQEEESEISLMPLCPTESASPSRSLRPDKDATQGRAEIMASDSVNAPFPHCAMEEKGFKDEPKARDIFTIVAKTMLY